MRTSAYYVSGSTFFSNPVTTDWSFQGIPLTLGYEYKVYNFNQAFSLVTGLGISYFFSKVTGTTHPFDQTATRTGNGYGVHGTIGLISELTRNLSMVTRARYRYSNGMAFTDKSGDVKVEFTGFDLSSGLAWAF